MLSTGGTFSRRDKKDRCYRFIILICTTGGEQMDALYDLAPRAECTSHVFHKIYLFTCDPKRCRRALGEACGFAFYRHLWWAHSFGSAEDFLGRLSPFLKGSFKFMCSCCKRFCSGFPDELKFQSSFYQPLSCLWSQCPLMGWCMMSR